VMAREQLRDCRGKHLVKDDFHGRIAASSVRFLAVSSTATACWRLTVGN
jgi:hypothetical protein